MASSNTLPISLSNLDFNGFMDAFKTALKSQDRFKDYDFAGSDISLLLEILTRNTEANAFLLNMSDSERWIDSGQLRESVVSSAKELNYLPRSRSSSSTTVDIVIRPFDQPSSITIPRFFTVVSQQQTGLTGNQSLIFSTAQDITIRNNGGQYVASNVPVYEGRVVTEYFVANSNNRYVISSSNVDISSVEVIVMTSSTDSTNTTFDFAESLYGLDGNSAVYFLQGAYNDQYELEFGNGISGRALTNGNIIQVRYRDSLGSDGDGISRFVPATNINGYTDISVVLSSNSQSSSGGSEREDIESIRFNAPRHYSVQGRAINSNDYRSLILSKFPTIQNAVVFGGEELPQKKYGKVAVCVKPYNNQIVPNSVKSSILSYLSELSGISIDPFIIDPDFYYVEVVSNVDYNTDLTTEQDLDIETRIVLAIRNYSLTRMSDFKKNFEYSRFTSAIDNADASIISNDTTVRLIKRIAPTVGQEVTTTINFFGQLNTSFNNVSTIESSYFVYTYNDVDYQVKIKDDGKERLNLYYTGLNNQDTILVQNIGSVNYVTGIVSLNALNIKSYPGYISVYARMKNKDYNVYLNQILLIDSVDVDINVNGKSE